MGARMRRLGTWLWKEWRDQRAVTIGILLAIPGLTALAFLAFGEHLAGAWMATVRTTFLGIALGLVNFAIASSLFASEIRRGTMQTVRRLPGAFGTAFLAKVLYLVVLVVVVIAWQGLCLAVAEAGNRGIAMDLGLREGLDGGPFRALALLADIAAFPTSALWITGLGMGVLCLWTLLVSTWMGRSGVAGVGALVLLAALGAPFVLFFLEHVYFFPGPWALAGWTVSIAAVVALLAAAASYLRGQRFAGRPLRPFLAGAAVLLVAVGGGYAYAHVALDAWLEIDPHDESFRIYEAHVGAGERHLFLTVHRGAAWIGDRNLGTNDQQKGWGTGRGTPLQAWVVDLETGSIEKAYGKQARYFTAVPEATGVGAGRPLDPEPALVCYHLSKAADEEPGAVTWWDATVGTPARTLPWGVRDPVSIGLVRRTLAATSWLRDAEGRRVWLRDGLYEREGDLPTVPEGLRPRPKRARALWPVPGGWYGTRMERGSFAGPRLFVDAATGQERELVPDVRVSSYGFSVMSEDFCFGYEPIDPKQRNGKTRRVVVPLKGGEPFEPRNPPKHIGQVIGRDLVLALRAEPGDRMLYAWNPMTGASRPIAWRGEPLSGIAHVAVHGTTSDGRMLLRLDSGQYGLAYVVLSADRRFLLPVTGWQKPSVGFPIALLADDALVLVEDQRRIVRRAPGKEPEVLFPRRAP